MPIKITLVTPPDIYENDNDSLFLINLSEEEQNIATDWFSRLDTDQSLNIYFYQGEINLPWFFHAMAASSYKYINIDADAVLTNLLTGYILGKNNVFYKTEDQNAAEVYTYINSNRVKGVVDFLERVIDAKQQ
jgi:hypothetical protein